MLLTILERGPWKRDLAIAAGSAFVVTLATKFGEGMGETFTQILRRRINAKEKAEEDADKAQKPDQKTDGSDEMEIESENVVGLVKPPGWAVYLPVTLSQHGTVIRDDGRLFWSKGIVFGHKVVAIDLTTMEIFEESEERFRKLPDEHPLNIPYWSNWSQITENTPDGVLVAQVLWDSGPQFFGIVQRIGGEIKVKPFYLNKTRQEVGETFDETNSYRIVPPVLAAKLEI